MNTNRQNKYKSINSNESTSFGIVGHNENDCKHSENHLSFMVKEKIFGVLNETDFCKE